MDQSNHTHTAPVHISYTSCIFSSSNCCTQLRSSGKGFGGEQWRTKISRYWWLLAEVINYIHIHMAARILWLLSLLHESDCRAATVWRSWWVQQWVALTLDYWSSITHTCWIPVFYQDWWNAREVSAYWRLWNMPVHYWLVRHVYFPSVRSGCSKTGATFVVFLFSAIVSRSKYWSF